MLKIQKNSLVHSTFATPFNTKDTQWYGVWSNQGWLEDINFPVLIVEQFVGELDKDGNNCSVITAQGTNVWVNSIDLDFLHWEDLNRIERMMFESLQKKGVQFMLCNGEV